MSRFTIDITDNQTSPLHRGNFGPDAYGLKFTTVHPGGCGLATFRLAANPGGPVVIPAHLGENYRVNISDGGEIFWAGRMEDIQFHHGSGGRYWQVTAKGYGVNLADNSEQTYNVSNVQTSAIVEHAVALAPQITATSITATSFTLSNATAINLTGFNAALQIAWAMQFGDSSFNPQVFYVYPDPNGTIRATFKPRPSTPDVFGYLADFESAEFGLQGRQLYNRVSVLYNGGASYATVNSTAHQGAGPAGWGFVKEFLAVIPQITQSADATQAAAAFLINFLVPRVAATNLVVPSGERMPLFVDSNYQPIRPWRIRAGSLFRFRDVDTGANAAGNLAFLNEFLIDETEYDEESQTLTIRPENYDTVIESSLAQVRSLLTGRLTV